MGYSSANSRGDLLAQGRELFFEHDDRPEALGRVQLAAA